MFAHTTTPTDCCASVSLGSDRIGSDRIGSDRIGSDLISYGTFGQLQHSGWQNNPDKERFPSTYNATPANAFRKVRSRCQSMRNSAFIATPFNQRNERELYPWPLSHDGRELRSVLAEQVVNLARAAALARSAAGDISHAGDSAAGGGGLHAWVQPKEMVRV
jgi:hypothetical protein